MGQFFKIKLIIYTRTIPIASNHRPQKPPSVVHLAPSLSQLSDQNGHGLPVLFVVNSWCTLGKSKVSLIQWV